MIENVMAMTPYIRETWFHSSIRDIFETDSRYHSYLKGGYALPDAIMPGRHKGNCYLLITDVSHSGNIWQVRVRLTDPADPSFRRASLLPLDAPGYRTFRQQFMNFMATCGISFSAVNRKRALWSETLSIQQLAMIGKAYDVYCSGIYKKDPGFFDFSVFKTAVGSCPNSYLALTLKGWADYKFSAEKDALSVFKDALQMNPYGRDAQHGLMWTFARLNDEKRAVEWGKKAALSCGEPENAGIYNALSALGFQDVRAKLYAQALIQYQQAATRVAAMTSPLKTAGLLYNEGVVYYHSGNDDASLRKLGASLALREKTLGQSHPDCLNTLDMMAEVYRRKGELRQALDCHRRVLEIRRSFSGPPNLKTASACVHVGLDLYDLGRYSASLEYTRRALNIRLAILGKDHPDTATVFHNLGLAYQMTGAYSKAHDAFEKALAIRLKNDGPDHIETALSYNDLGAVYARMGDAKRALTLYDACLPVIVREKGENNEFTAAVYQNKGEALQALGHYKEARFFLEKALTIRKKLFGPDHPETALSYNSLGCVNYAMGDNKEAGVDFTRALTIRGKILGIDHPLTASSCFNLGAVFYAEGKDEEASHYAGMAFTRSGSGAFRELSWRVLDLLRALNETQGHLDKAVIFGKMAVNTIQDLRRQTSEMGRPLQIAFMTDKHSVFENLAGILIRLGRLAEAQEILAMMKEEDYFDFIQRDQSEISVLKRRAMLTDLENEWSKEYCDKTRQLSDLDRKCVMLEEKSTHTPLTKEERNREKYLHHQRAMIGGELKDLILKKFPAASRAKGGDVQENQDSLKILQARLAGFEKGAVILTYLTVNDRLQMILTTTDRQISCDTDVSTQDLNQLISDYLKKINQLNKDSIKVARQLYDILIAPVAHDLEKADAKTILVSACGPLRYLPMAALFDGSSYLAGKYAFVLLTPVIHDRQAGNVERFWEIAGFGTSEKVDDDFTALPSVKRELDAIIIENDRDKDGIFKGVERLNQRFTRTAFENVVRQEYPVIHIATHFSCRPGTASDSFLLLGDGSRLSLMDIHKALYRFNGTDLITLSACQTAVDIQDKNGREFESLGMLVQEKGANNVIASLWPVSDQSTPALMERMYALHKQNPGISDVEALREAQVWFFRRYKPEEMEDGGGDDASNDPIYRRPYFWAPFILMSHL